MRIEFNDFTKWAYSDLNNNKTRADVAEYLVAKSLNLDTRPKQDWLSYDLITKQGLRIEVKASAFVQSWKQSKLSQIRFDIAPKAFWDEVQGRYSKTKQRNADVYVFCLLKEIENINPLDTDQWEFYVVETLQLNSCTGSQKSIGLKYLKEVARPLAFKELKKEILH